MEKVSGRRVLVSGAAGFVGANLVRTLLKLGAEVHAIIHPLTNPWRITEILADLVVHPADLTDALAVKNVVAAARPEFIFHTAARRISPAFPEPHEVLMANILGTFNLLEAASSLDYSCFVHLGSSTEYGTKASSMKEADILEPVTFFGATKAAATLLCQQYAQAAKRPLIILRPFLVYGYWDVPTRLIPTAIKAVLANEELALTSSGFRRDYVFIDDLLEACLLALEADFPPGEIVNIGSGCQAANEEVVSAIQALIGRRVVVKEGAYPSTDSDKKYWLADIDKARRLLGWEPRHALEAGLEKTIAWYKLNRGGV